MDRLLALFKLAVAPTAPKNAWTLCTRRFLFVKQKGVGK